MWLDAYREIWVLKRTGIIVRAWWWKVEGDISPLPHSSLCFCGLCVHASVLLLACPLYFISVLLFLLHVFSAWTTAHPQSKHWLCTSGLFYPSSTFPFHQVKTSSAEIGPVPQLKFANSAVLLCQWHLLFVTLWVTWSWILRKLCLKLDRS